MKVLERSQVRLNRTRKKSGRHARSDGSGNTVKDESKKVDAIMCVAAGETVTAVAKRL